MREYKIYSLSDPDSLEVRYIGITTNTLSARLSQHIHESKHKKGTYKRNWIKTILNKNKKPIISLIEVCNSDNWEEREKYWISHFNNLTNAREGGKGVIVDRLKDSIERSAESKRKPIVQLTKAGKYVQEFESIKEAQEKLGFKSNSSITNVLTKNYRAKFAGGYYWVYKEDYDNNNYSIPTIKSKANRVLCIDEEGNKKVFNSAKEAGKELNIFYATIRSLCSGTYKYNTKIKYKFSYIK